MHAVGTMPGEPVQDTTHSSVAAPHGPIVSRNIGSLCNSNHVLSKFTVSEIYQSADTKDLTVTKLA